MGVVANVLKSMELLLGDFYYPVAVIAKILGVLLISIIAAKVGSFIVGKVFERQKALRHGYDEKKINTMSTLIASVLKYAIYIMAGVIILTDILKLTSVLAAAGIGGIAVGLGAQGLIKDIISGFFIVMEDQYAVGDNVTIDNMSGKVEELGLRLTKLRDFNGDLHMIPNSEIRSVTNHTRGNRVVLVDVPVAYETDIEKAVEAASRACIRISEKFDKIVMQPKVLGITEFGTERLSLRISCQTPPDSQWEIEREIRKLIVEEFAKKDIKFYSKNWIAANRDTAGGDAKNG